MLYQTNFDNTARFALGELGTKNLAVFGVNPSTATDKVSDSTIQRVKGYSRAHGFDGWLMLNLYPQRTTDPRGLHAEVDLKMHAENLEHIAQSLTLAQNFTLCAAWGQLIRERDYLATCLECINASIGEHDWHSIGTPTKEGHPRHPLYVPTANPLLYFDLEKYLNLHTISPINL
ncbi:MAG: DUF1643 domain-containing protein [Patescibacteria group bacterium]